MISTLALFATVVVIDAPLRTPVAPAGMLSFQFAGDLPTALTIMQAWGTLGQIHAALSLGLDYFFLFVYANAISMTCVMISQACERKSPWFSQLGIATAWSAFGAGILDALENSFLILLLLGQESPLWPWIARLCATSKFVVVGWCILYAVAGLTVLMIGRIMGPSAHRS